MGCFPSKEGLGTDSHALDPTQIDMHEELHVREIGNSHIKNFITANRINSSSHPKMNLQGIDVSVETKRMTWKSRLLSAVRFKRNIQGEDGEDEIPSCSSRGIPLSFLQEFIEKNCGGRKVIRTLSTDEVKKRFVDLYTKESELSYVEKLISEGREELVCSPSWVIVYDFTDPFLDVVDALLLFFSQPSNTQMEPMLFFDIFCQSQNSEFKTEKTRNTYVTERFSSIHVLSVVSNCENDCEIVEEFAIGALSSKITGKRYEIVITEQGKLNLFRDLNTDIGRIQQLVSKIDSAALEKKFHLSSSDPSPHVSPPLISSSSSSALSSSPSLLAKLPSNTISTVHIFRAKLSNFLRNGFHSQYDVYIANILENFFIRVLNDHIRQLENEGNS